MITLLVLSCFVAWVDAINLGMNLLLTSDRRGTNVACYVFDRGVSVCAVIIQKCSSVAQKPVNRF